VRTLHALYSPPPNVNHPQPLVVGYLRRFYREAAQGRKPARAVS